MEITKISNSERALWIGYDKNLYRRWLQGGLGIKDFIHANREEIDKAINESTKVIRD